MRTPSVAVLVLLAACGGTQISHIPLHAPPRPMQPRPVESVELYTAGVPARPYVEIMLIEARQEPGSRDSAATVFYKLRLDAARHGCDAVVLGGASDEVADATTLHGYRATCVVYPPDTPATAAGTPAPR